MPSLEKALALAVMSIEFMVFSFVFFCRDHPFDAINIRYSDWKFKNYFAIFVTFYSVDIAHVMDFRSFSSVLIPTFSRNRGIA